MPHKQDDENFMLSEFWMTVEKGTDKDHTATSVEKFEGTTKNQDQALGLQGLSVNVDAVVAGYNKAMKGCNASVIKLQRAVSSAEPVQVTLRKRKSPGLAPFQDGFEACKKLVTETYEVLEDQRGLKKSEVGEQGLVDATNLLNQQTESCKEAVEALQVSIRANTSAEEQVKEEDEQEEEQEATGVQPVAPAP